MSTRRARAVSVCQEISEQALFVDPTPGPHLSVEKDMSDTEEDIRFMFREAVGDSLANLLDISEATALVAFMGGASLEDPEKVYRALDSILQGGAHVLKDAIAEEFHAKVDLLKRRLGTNPDSVIWVAKFVQRMEGKHNYWPEDPGR